MVRPYSKVTSDEYRISEHEEEELYNTFRHSRRWKRVLM